MAAVEPIHARRAALLLHGLPLAARQRVVAKLSSSESAKLKPLLDELTQLGVSPALGEQLQQIAVIAKSVPVKTDEQPAPERELTVLERAERLSADDVARCLQRCAPITVAHLLRSHEWPWKARALGLMPEARRLVDLAAMGSPTFAPAVLRAFCERLCQHAAQHGAGPGVRGLAPSDSERRIQTPEPPARHLRKGIKRFIPWIR